ncbi:Kelch domain-containing protein 10 [Thelohanellus kitauei]|uniref:Kelch domain-containing protein 10 n=1 Tax=Thelohanellus kitauei TaxID=669202 RepID=A0A0C2N5F1_THEKT|nr:Kelch domain-containing protein 10 [Thelohanellus kitauei]
MFDFSTSEWTKKATKSSNEQYPDDRILESFAFSSKFGYMCGGNISNTNVYYSDVWKIDLETLEWFKMDYSLNAGICFHCSTVVDDSYMYYFGGLGHGFDGFNTLGWFIIRPPSLYRLCLQTIGHSPNRKNNTISLPAAIADELNLNDNNSSCDH